ncbi:Meiosis regulator and mRNA stability factor 1 [Geodia barretti]|uniref:Meiosis regulator and mRNA stability factor 1 n=1 Tax=Geodia barretti TaxID=519541 RepID=A0AA35WKB1_GEOBA|nr:Meiosis regulator and mRNA stability factor 1 [Geodia barretti]
MRNASSEAVRLGTGNTSPHNDPNYPYHDYTYGVGGGEILGPQPAGVYFGVGGSDSSDSSDDEDDLEYTPAEMAQLLSLNELDMQPGSSDSEEEEEEGEEVRENKRRNRRGKGNNSSPDPNSQIVSSVLSPSPRQAQSRHAAHARQPEPVGLFWDIENCSVPTNKSAFTVATKMRRVFFEGKREAEFMVVCDITKERKDVINALNKAQVTLVHVNAVAKNAADDKLRQSLRRFAHTYPAPSTVVLVSSDVNFSSELNDLRHVHNMTIVLVHSKFTSDALKVFAQQLISYEQFLEDVEGPKGPQQSSLPNILMVTNLPKHFPPKKISSRLGQLSDNCGGRVLGVDPASGTARILFRTHDWAVKAEKRMRGEDVFGCRINLCLDYSQRPPNPPPPPLQNHHPPHIHPHPPPLFPHPPPPGSGPQGFHQISGRPLGHSFPPAHRPSPLFPRSPPLPRFPPPQPGFVPRPPPPQSYPLLRSPLRGPPPQFSGPPPPNVPLPPSIQLPRRPPPDPASYSKMAATPAPRPEGKILIIKIQASNESDQFEELGRQVLMISLEANIKMERGRSLVMWHSFSELQMLLRLDFRGTAVVRKEDLIRTMWDKGDLKPNVAGKFVEQCVKSLGDVCRRQGLPWLATSCGWSSDEEEERRTKSQVIALLRQFPHCWLKWTRFKTKYNESYHSALSEMAVHAYCKGAVMILGKPDNNQSQVIIRYEMSPLVRISGQKKVWTAVQKKVVDMVSTRPNGRIKLLE